MGHEILGLAGNNERHGNDDEQQMANTEVAVVSAVASTRKATIFDLWQFEWGPVLQSELSPLRGSPVDESQFQPRAGPGGSAH